MNKRVVDDDDKTILGNDEFFELNKIRMLLAFEMIKKGGKKAKNLCHQHIQMFFV